MQHRPAARWSATPVRGDRGGRLQHGARAVVSSIRYCWPNTTPCTRAANWSRAAASLSPGSGVRSAPPPNRTAAHRTAPGHAAPVCGPNRPHRRSRRRRRAQRNLHGAVEADHGGLDSVRRQVFRTRWGNAVAIRLPARSATLHRGPPGRRTGTSTTRIRGPAAHGREHRIPQPDLGR